MKTLFIALGMSFTLGAQQPLSNSNSTLTLTINGESGTNGLAVAYNPKNNLYYSIFAGNEVYPLETHTANGTTIASQEAGCDARGMWYNPKKKCLEGILYGNNGMVTLKLDANGKIEGSVLSSFSFGMDDQTVATYAEKKKAVMFVEGNKVSFFKPGSTTSKTVFLTMSSGVELNTNGPAYTGVKNYEIALLESGGNVVHLFSEKTGEETGKVKLNFNNLGEDFEIPSFFRVSYTNNMLFVYDVNSRTWSGFKLF